MADSKKKTKLQPYDKDHEITPVLAYFVIVDFGNSNAIVDIFRRAGCTASFISMGNGTASQTVRDILGIEDNRKEIIVSMINEDKLPEALVELSAYFVASKRNKGIGFSIKLTGVAGVRMYQFLANNL